MYITQFEALRMKDDEEVSQFNAKLSNLVNIMRSLGEGIPKSKVVRKVHRSLPKRFRPKVTAIEESKDLEVMKLEELIGSLQTFEVAIKEPTKKNDIALKIKEPSESNEDSDDDLTLLAKRFKKFFRKNTKDYSKNKQVKKSYPRSKKNKYFFKEPPICYECKGRGHIVEDCGNTKTKYKSRDKAMATT